MVNPATALERQVKKPKVGKMILHIGIQELDLLALSRRSLQLCSQSFSLRDQDIAEEDVRAGRVEQAD